MRLPAPTALAASIIALTFALMPIASPPLIAQTPAKSPASAAAENTIEQIRSRLLRLPYYGVFDFLAFQYEKGTVTLLGYDYRGTLKNDAERAVKQAPGVDQVINKIEQLPVSPNDDDLRWKTYYAIYSDPFLSRYAPGGGLLWGFRRAHRHPLGAFGAGSRFPGMQPAGDYPIHIIVKNGKITLIGEVDSTADKTMAVLKARGVSGSFGVEDELSVDTKGK
jgi:hypothetical protein